jgi:DNA-binding XRE family transcriptional regulator
MKFKERIRELRTALGLSQRQFAEVAGLSTTAIYYYECGRRIPREKSLQKIISSFHISPKKFYNGLRLQEERQGRKIYMEAEWLRSLYVNQGFTAAQIARLRSCSKSAVLSRLREYNIERRPRFGRSGPQRIVSHPEVVQELLANRYECQEWLGLLPSTEAWVVSRRLGLLSERVHTLQEIGNALGLTRERIRQIQNSALDRLRRLHVAAPAYTRVAAAG